MMRITILYNGPTDPSDPAEGDVLVQRDVIAAMLRARGHTVDCVAATLDLDAVRGELGRLAPEVVFNLVEALGGTDRLMPLAALLLEGLGLPFTGCGAAAMLATSDKVAAKRALRDAGLPTPDWSAAGEPPVVAGAAAGRWIIKPRGEHASTGVDDRAVVDVVDAEGLRSALDARTREIGRPSFAERYVAGREFNLSLIADAGGEPLVLPPAEIDFSQFPPEKLRIVGYAAKWDADSFEYQHTPRSFEFPAADQSLLAELQRLAGACWRLFDLRGFARVDFRVDAAGRPWILEVNVNPCLAPDAGWMAAVERARIPPAEALERVAAAALRP